MAEAVYCDLEHARPARAVVRIEVKSTRAGRPGHPMVRIVVVCASHARKLREMGLELVDA